MKSLVKFSLCLALLLATILIEVQGEEITDILNKMANKGESIDRIFKPAKKGFLGEGLSGVAYKGILLLNGMEVAMKFTSGKCSADHEYKIYTYLNAINNPNVEAFGVPAIYYYGTWNNYFMMALTLLDNTFNDRFRNNKFTKIDFLIAVREYVRISKYLHSCGVFQNDVKLTHMMFRKHMGFLYDFNTAMLRTNGTQEYKLEGMQIDWRDFFDVMRKCLVKHGDWLGFEKKTKDNAWRMQYDNFRRRILEDARTPEKFDGLRRIFIDFAKYAYGGAEILEIPFYDLIYQNVVEEIAKLERELNVRAVPSWLSTADKNAAIVNNDSIPPISEIRNPFGSDEIEIKEVNYEFFNEFYHDKLNAEPEPDKKSKKSTLKFWK